jgi:hypothetical protein
MTDAEFQNRLAEYEGMVRLLTAKLEELAAENARLRSSENNAHSVLREVYNDPTASPAVRVKAAGLALSHESAPLKPVSQLELKAEEPVIPLADLVRQRRAYVERMNREQRNIRVLPNGQVLVLDERNDGNGQDDGND